MAGAVAAGMLVTAALAATSAEGNAAFEKRRDTMKAMGRSVYVGVGQVVKGKTEYGPDTVVAAETAAKLATSIGTLFPPGSDVSESKVKPEIFGAKDRVDQLVLAVQSATTQLVPAVKTGDKATITTAYTAVDNACKACHSQFRREE
jgi:cytochrome c556